MNFKNKIDLAIKVHTKATGVIITLKDVKKALLPDSNDNSRTARLSQLSKSGAINIDQANALIELFPNEPKSVFLNHVDIVRLRTYMINRFTTDELTYNRILRNEWNCVNGELDDQMKTQLINKYL